MAKYFVYPFGINGDLTPIPDTGPTSGPVNYQYGFGIDYQLPFPSDPSALPIPRNEFNELMFDTTGAIQQYQQNGVPDFITAAENLGVAFPYPIYARVRYDDGGGFKVYENQVAANTTTPPDPSWRVISGGQVPAGSMTAYAGLTVPPGFLLCDGAAVSRATYSALFTAIGVLWGIGDGSTTFNLPNMVRRVPMGAGGTGTAVIGNVVGNIGGTESVAISINEMPNHNHPGSVTTIGTGQFSGGSGRAFNPTLNPLVFNWPTAVAPQGGGLPHNNVQPAAIVQWIIKT